MKRGVFKRSLDSLESIFLFTSEFVRENHVDPSLLPAIDLIVEELFTNMVEHSSASTADVPMEMSTVDGGVEVTLADEDADPFDITKVPEVDVERAVEELDPGGLGLHLVRKFADSVEYHYQFSNRQARIVFRKTAGSGGDDV